MNLEIHKPELVQRVQTQIQSSHFHDTDELIEKGIDALDEQASTAAVPGSATGAVVLAALQASPYRTSISRRPAYSLPICGMSRFAVVTTEDPLAHVRRDIVFRNVQLANFRDSDVWR